MRILIIEDDLELCDAIRTQLEKADYLVDICNSGTDALFYALQESYDIMLLDRMLPGADGLTILQSIRRNQIATPVIMATALDGIKDRIDGLDSGADDYIVKPFDIQELLARIRALSRRPVKLSGTDSYCYADLTLNLESHELRSPNIAIFLSKREALLLGYFIKNHNQTLSRALLLSYVWGPDSEVEEGNLDNYIHFLRKRLKTVASHTQITTVHGVGYRLEELG